MTMINMDKPSFSGLKSRYKSEFNAGALEFERLDLLLKEADRCGMNATRMDKEFILPYFCSVKQIYLFLSSLIKIAQPQRTKELQNECNTLWLDIIDYINSANFKNNYRLGMVKRIDDFYEKCLLIKQLMGLSIPVNKDESVKTVMRRYLQSKKTKELGKFDRDIRI